MKILPTSPRESTSQEKGALPVMNMVFTRRLPFPCDIKSQFPVSDELQEIKRLRDNEIRHILVGESPRFLLIIGPCSADQREPVLAYLEKLSSVAADVSEEILIVPRVYTNKPRTSGIGYMGMLHQPDPCKPPNLLEGLIAVRQLFLDALTFFHFTCADELLYPENYRFYSDVLSYVTVGARSIENQFHRLVSSGLDIPVGMKNPLSGDLATVANTIAASNHPQAFFYREWEVTTTGNPLSHAILRGSIDHNGISHPNYSSNEIQRTLQLLEDKKAFLRRMVIDTNHSNSGKNPFLQQGIALDILNRRWKDPVIADAVCGLMVESYLVDGAQSVDGNVFGQSITDPCLGWDKSRELIYRIADELSRQKLPYRL